MNALEWKPWNMCGVQALLDDGETVTVGAFQCGNAGGFALSYRFGRYEFSTPRRCLHGSRTSEHGNL